MLLAIDTSTTQMGLALYDGANIPAEFVWQSGFHHTQELAPMLVNILKHASVPVTSIDALGVALGPGSFTSLRVGLAFAKGLAFSRHIPIVGIPSLEIVAAAIPVSEATVVMRQQAPTGQTEDDSVDQDPLNKNADRSIQRKLIALIHAGRNRLAFAWFTAGENSWQIASPIQSLTADELAHKIHEPVIICGEMSAEQRRRLERKYRNVTLASPLQCVRRPGILAELAWQKLKAGDISPAASLAPIYLHVAGAPLP
jgi:tRNA threonylcarbamoyladenosine biosynthesis protein TsaB